MSKLKTFVIISDTYANSTRLKDRIAGYFPDMIAVCKGHGHETLLMFDKILPIRSIRPGQFDSGWHAFSTCGANCAT